MIGLVLALVVALGAVAVLVIGGGDGPAASPTTTAATTTATTVPDTEPVATLPVLTAPEQTATTLAPEVSPWEGVEVAPVDDDAGVFTLAVPADWYVSTEARQVFGATAAGVSAGPDLDAYVNGDDALGVTAAVLLESSVGGATGVASSYLDVVASCTAEDWQSGHPTVWGDAELLLFDGCGTGAMHAKTVLVIDVLGLTVMVAVQGLGPADGDLLVLAEAFLNTLVFRE